MLAVKARVDRQGGENGQRSARVVGGSHRLRPSAARFSSGVYGRTSWAWSLSTGSPSVCTRDGAARVQARCTVRPAQAACACKAAARAVSVARGDQAWLKRSAWEADGAHAQELALRIDLACVLHVDQRASPSMHAAVAEADRVHWHNSRNGIARSQSQ